MAVALMALPQLRFGQEHYAISQAVSWLRVPIKHATGE
jgi:hypothetical protein